MLYIIGDRLENYGGGIKRKIIEQNDAFNNSGLKSLIYEMLVMKNRSVINKIKYRLPLFYANAKWDYGKVVREKQIYIRRYIAWDRKAVKFFKKIKENNPSVRIVYEIPTYPYDSEMTHSLKSFPLLLIDRYNRRYIKQFVDRIATLTDDKEIFGVPTLKIGNGIDVEKIRQRHVGDLDDIHAIAVADFQFWHGYDRFIEGMRIYYAGNPSRKVRFHLVGRGSEFDRYQKMITDYGLEDYVILHGQQTGEALDAIYDQCNFGIASLGCYRKGMNGTQELKSREYLAKGLPFVSSVKITDIPEEDKNNIYLQVANNDSPINIESVLSFYDQIYNEGAALVNTRLRKFAKDHFSMEVAMKEVIDFFKSGK